MSQVLLSNWNILRSENILSSCYVTFDSYIKSVSSKLSVARRKVSRNSQLFKLVTFETRSLKSH